MIKRTCVSVFGAAALSLSALSFADSSLSDLLNQTQEDPVLDSTLGNSEASYSEFSKLEVGMPVEEAIELLGGNPDSETEIGAACGVLDILTWDEDGTRIISVDGTVTSIYEKSKQ